MCMAYWSPYSFLPGDVCKGLTLDCSRARRDCQPKASKGQPPPSASLGLVWER